MAWMVTKSIAYVDSPHVRYTEEGVQEILRGHAKVVDRLSHFPPGHPLFIKKGDVPAGLPIAFPDKPREAFIERLEGPLPDALTEIIVNDRIKQAVENIEPDVHQFIPVIVTMPDGKRDDSWWSMRACHRVDALAQEHCEDLHEYRPRPVEHPDWYYYRSNEDSRMKLVIRKDIIAGMAMWYDWKFQRHFFSEELGQYFIDNNIRGFCLPTDELGVSMHVAEV